MVARKSYVKSRIGILLFLILLLTVFCYIDNLVYGWVVLFLIPELFLLPFLFLKIGDFYSLPTSIEDVKVSLASLIDHNMDDMFLRKFSKDIEIPAQCYRPMKEEEKYILYKLDRKCLTNFINDIKKKYKIDNICLEVANSLEEYETCIRNIDKYGYEPLCWKFLTDEEAYTLCINNKQSSL